MPYNYAPQAPVVTPHDSGALRRGVALMVTFALAMLGAFSYIAPVNLDRPPWYISLTNGAVKVAWYDPGVQWMRPPGEAVRYRARLERPWTTTIDRTTVSAYLSMPLALGLIVPILILFVRPAPSPPSPPSEDEAQEPARTPAPSVDSPEGYPIRPAPFAPLEHENGYRQAPGGRMPTDEPSLSE